MTRSTLAVSRRTQRTLKAILIVLLALALEIAVGSTEPMPVLAAANTIGPSAPGSSTALSLSGGLSNWLACSATGGDYVFSTSAGYQLDLYTLPDPGLNGAINSVTVYMEVQTDGGIGTQPSARTAIRTNGTTLTGTSQALTGSWATYSTAYTTNPTTASAWTWIEVNALEAGVDMRRASNTGMQSRCDHVYVVVDYADPTTLAINAAMGTYGGTANLTATLTVTAGGAAVSGRTITFMLNGSPAGTAITDSSGVASIPDASLAGINAATYATGVGASFAGDAGYGASSSTNSLTVDPKTASVTPNPSTKVYGDADPLLTGTLNGFLAGDNVTATYSRTPGETVAGSPYTISATLSPAGVLGNYNITYNTASFTITPKAASVTPDAKSKTYGDPDPALTGTLSGFLAGDNAIATYSRTPGETVAGSFYTISATLSPAGVLGNYNITYNTASFAVTAKTASVTPNPSSKVYGDADPLLTGTLTGFLAGDNVIATYSRTPGETVAGSPHTISATLSPAGVLGNYNITYNTADFTIMAVTLTVTGMIAEGKSYDGNAIAQINFDSTSLVGVLAGDDVSLDTSVAVGAFPDRNVGTGKTVTVTGLVLIGVDAGNYTLIPPTAAADINKADLTITAVTYTKTYDSTTSAAGVPTVAGLQSGDTVTGLAETYDTSDAGSAKILTVAAYTVNDGNGGNNYTVALETDTTGVINMAALTIAANNRTKTYGNAVALAATESSTAGLLGGDAVTSLTLTSPGTGAAAAAGTYFIVPSAAVGTGLSNYNIEYVNGTLTVNPKDLTIAADNRDKPYGTMVTFSGTEFTADGLVNGDTITSVTLISTGASVDATADGSPYAIVPSAASGSGVGNYNITYVNGSLTVNKVSVGLSLSSSASASAEGNSLTFTATVTGTGATGTVTFEDGGTTLGSSVLRDGTATYAISTLAIGSHSITAVYSGDANFGSSTSSVLELMVNPRMKAAVGFNWWALVGALIAADLLMGLFLLLLVFRRRRRNQAQPFMVGKGTQVSGRAAAKNHADAGLDLADSASPIPAAVGESVTGSPLPATDDSGTRITQLERELEASFHKVQETMEAAIQAISHTVELRDPYVATHQKRVSELACAIAKEMGLTAGQIDGIRAAGMLHDVGKITVPTEILSKPGELSAAEISLIKDHPKVAYDILKNVQFDWPVAQIILQHHERMDGSGYPYGIAGKDILMEARILAVADVVEAMCTDRPYRPALELEDALAELATGYGTLYDPEVVAACKKLLGEGRFKIGFDASPSGTESGS